MQSCVRLACATHYIFHTRSNNIRCRAVKRKSAKINCKCQNVLREELGFSKITLLVLNRRSIRKKLDVDWQAIDES